MGTHLVVAIDGPAGSGKSTVAMRVAQILGCTLLDTGAIYRSLALRARELAVDWSDGPGLAIIARDLEISFDLRGDINHVFLDGRDVTREIRTPEISNGASRVSAAPEVRQALLDLQRMVAEEGAVVTEGRDTGTVVFPKAQVKVFLVADPVVRARRRQLELMKANHNVSLEEVLEQQNARDAADSGRDVAPLRQAHDAAVVDTTRMEIDEVVEAIIGLVRARDPAIREA
jgi:cytidylate kinase